jgi:hypothetical protein
MDILFKTEFNDPEYQYKYTLFGPENSLSPWLNDHGKD